MLDDTGIMSTHGHLRQTDNAQQGIRFDFVLAVQRTELYWHADQALRAYGAGDTIALREIAVGVAARLPTDHGCGAGPRRCRRWMHPHDITARNTARTLVITEGNGKR